MQDKWRNLLRASGAEKPNKKGVGFLIYFCVCIDGGVLFIQMFQISSEFVFIPIINGVVNTG